MSRRQNNKKPYEIPGLRRLQELAKQMSWDSSDPVINVMQQCGRRQKITHDDIPSYYSEGLSNTHTRRLTEMLNECAQAMLLPSARSAFLGVEKYPNPNMAKLDKIVDDCNRSIGINPKDPVGHLCKGIINACLGRQRQAVKDYSKAISSNPDNAFFLRLRGNARSELGHYKSAIQDYSKAIKIYFIDVDSMIRRAKAYIQLEMYEKALKDCRIAAWLDNLDADAWTLRGDVYVLLGNNSLALKDYDKVIKYTPKSYHKSVVIKRARINQQREDLDAALKDFAYVIFADPKSSVGHTGKGDVLLMKGLVDAAYTSYDKAIELDKTDAKAFLGRGMASKLRGDEFGALEDIEEYLWLEYKYPEEERADLAQKFLDDL